METVIDEPLAEAGGAVKGMVQKEKPLLVVPSHVTAGKTPEKARERQVCAQWGKQ